MRKMILTVATVAIAAASARAQALTAPAGQAYTIISTADATAVNPVTYQWYRDNNVISGATSASYTVPRQLAYGENVQFYRLAKTVDCTGDIEKKSNTVTVTFTGYIMPEGCTLVVDGVCWAAASIDNLQTFAARPDMKTPFYQWNRQTAYSVEDPITPEWKAAADTSSTWKFNPCPPNWRLPSQTEAQALVNSGSTWAAANARGNAVQGRFFGYNRASCSLPSNMAGCIFIPAFGYRETSGAFTYSANGYAWTSTQTYGLVFNSSSCQVMSSSKNQAFPIRCVR